MAAEDQARMPDACQARADCVLECQDCSAATLVFEKIIEVAARRAAMTRDNLTAREPQR